MQWQRWLVIDAVAAAVSVDAVAAAVSVDYHLASGGKP